MSARNDKVNHAAPQAVVACMIRGGSGNISTNCCTQIIKHLRRHSASSRPPTIACYACREQGKSRAAVSSTAVTPTSSICEREEMVGSSTNHGLDEATNCTANSGVAPTHGPRKPGLVGLPKPKRQDAPARDPVRQ